jgi:hypothetical protein
MYVTVRVASWLYQWSRESSKGRKRQVMYYVCELAFGHSKAGGEAVPDDHIIQAEQQSLALFARCFGGGQRYQTIGSYQTKDHKVVIESCTVIRAYASEVQEHWDTLCSLARAIALFLEQACVLVSVVQVNGSLTLVESDTLDSEKSTSGRPEFLTSS